MANCCGRSTYPRFNNYVLQVNGKLRDRIEVPEDISDKNLEELALANSAVKRFLSEKNVRKVVIVPKRLVNVVAG